MKRTACEKNNASIREDVCIRHQQAPVAVERLESSLGDEPARISIGCLQGL